MPEFVRKKEAVRKKKNNNQNQNKRHSDDHRHFNDKYTLDPVIGDLNLCYTILCIIDLFGIFPIIALPKPVINCGLYGTPLIITVVGLQLYTAILLGRSWNMAQKLEPQIKNKNRYPYAAVAEMALGKRAGQMVIFLIDASVFGAGIPNLLVGSQSLQIFWYKITGGNMEISFCTWLVLVGCLLCPIMWLGSPKDMKPIAITSVCTVVSVAAITWTCILRDASSPPREISLFDHIPNFRDFLSLYGSLAFQFDIHTMLLTVQVDMKDGSRISTAIIVGYFVTVTLFIATTMLAVLRYGLNVESNIIRGIPPSLPLYILSLLVTMQLCLSSAVGNSTLFQHIEQLLKIPRRFSVQRCVIRSGIIILAIFLGEVVPRFDLLMDIIGSTLNGPLMFIFPPLIFIRMCQIKAKREDCTNLLCRTKNKFMKSKKKVVNYTDALECDKRAGDTKLECFAYNMHSKYNTFPDIHRSENKRRGGGARKSAKVKKDGHRSQQEEIELWDYNTKWYDIILATVIMTLGMAATLAATYSVWSDSLTIATFSIPWYVNSSKASKHFWLSNNQL